MLLGIQNLYTSQFRSLKNIKLRFTERIIRKLNQNDAKMGPQWSQCGPTSALGVPWLPQAALTAPKGTIFEGAI